MKTVVIVGGGLAATLAARMLLNNCPQWDVIIVEDPKYAGKGGIQGESVTPGFLDLVQSEFGYENTLEWLKYSDYAFRVGGLLKGWANRDIFMYQYMNRAHTLPLQEWAKSQRIRESNYPTLDRVYSECAPAVHMMLEGYTPVIDVQSPMGRSEHDWAANLDASKLGGYLLHNLLSLDTNRFRYIADKVCSVKKDGDNIKALVLHEEEVVGDLFVDATGLGRLLIKEVNREIEDESYRFPNNRVVLGSIDRKGDKARNHISSTTASNGWIWDIPLGSKDTVGYMYSDMFMDPKDSIKELQELYPTVQQIRELKLTPSSVKVPWVGNVVAIGVAQGFVDPLEGAVLLQTKTHLVALTTALSLGDYNYIQVDSFNRACTDHRNAILAFVEMHYRGCQREDTEYWRYVRSIPHISKGLSDFISYDTPEINGRYFDWEKWTIFAASQGLIDINRIY